MDTKWEKHFTKLSDYALFLGITLKNHIPDVKTRRVDGKWEVYVEPKKTGAACCLISYNNLMEAFLALEAGMEIPKETIIIDTSEDYEDRTYSLAHELGHHIQIHRMNSPMTSEKLRRAYYRLQRGGKVSKANRDKIVAVEAEAWDLGEKLLTFLGIPITKAFLDMKTRCVRTYMEP